MKKFLSALLLLPLCFAAACGEPESSPTQKPQKEETEMLYQIEDVVKEDLIWDTKSIFATTPAINSATTPSNVAPSDNIELFKFSSAPYADKDTTWVLAAIGVPQTEMPKDGYPAVVLAHGGGGTVNFDWIKHWTNRGYVAMAYDVFGHELDANGNRIDNPESGPKETGVGSCLDSVDDPTQSWIYHAVYNAMLSNNILRARKDVDKNRIVMTGSSWGGHVTCATAGVDKRFAAFAPLNGCGYVYNDTTWLKDGTFGGNKERWAELYDPSTYLPYATKPMLFVSGVDDEWFSAYNRTQSAALVKGKTFFAQRTKLNHAQWTHADEIDAFFRHVLYKENSMTLIGDILLQDGVATLQYENQLFTKVNFVYTTSTDADSHQWVWESETISPVNGEYSYKIPEGATAYFFETVLSNTFAQSTAITIVDSNAQYQ
ncbi:MAG: hypothetical protein E7380_01035 [Clostridiales bacterium]|nr:hypothetical protein [Clostridiales bacterium]